MKARFYISKFFFFSSGCPKLGPPCRCRLWNVVKAICVTKYYRILALDLEVYIRRVGGEGRAVA